MARELGLRGNSESITRPALLELATHAILRPFATIQVPAVMTDRLACGVMFMPMTQVLQVKEKEQDLKIEVAEEDGELLAAARVENAQLKAALKAEDTEVPKLKAEIEALRSQIDRLRSKVEKT